ncbi:hypothetical protein HKX48_000023 [Thoreauomyces humboldtii]|nr:hypothetical protein HKX48_000023 [Thoreauomyces humboldtii]
MSEQSLQDALAWIKTILDNTRNPVQHTYADKYRLAAFLTNAALNARLTCLDLLGWNDSARALTTEWTATPPEKRRSVVLRFESDQGCEFLRTVEHTQESAVKELTVEVRSFFKSRSNRNLAAEDGDSTASELSSQQKTVTRIKEFVFKVQVRYQLSVSFGFVDRDDAETTVILTSAERTTEMISATMESPPIPLATVNNPASLDISFILKNLRTNDPEEKFRFCIDRSRPDCATPRRNRDIDEAVAYFLKANEWAGVVHHTIISRWKEQLTDDQIDIDLLTSRGGFIPIVPLFEKRPGSDSVLLSPGDLARFLQEQKRSLAERFDFVEKTMPPGKLLTVAEAKLLIVLQHKCSLARTYIRSINDIEDTLQQQLIAAIGRHVTPRDFTQLARSQGQKLFKKQYAPTPFSFAVQRLGHSPEGAFSIEFQHEAMLGKPKGAIMSSADRVVDSFSRTFTDSESTVMYVPISDSTTRVPFMGKRTVHACLFHQFSDSGPLTLALKARARQFSSFILMAGRISSSSDFEPLAAMIVRNKDEVEIPLELEQIPTAKEFADAIESLSPEQQSFARSFRALQLQATLFAVCIVEIKPQMEILLNLPPDSLTKEIKLSQDLEQLFIQYQIPSDLLRFDENAIDEPRIAPRIAAVKQSAADIFSMIKTAEKVELEGANARAQHAVLDSPADYVRVGYADHHALLADVTKLPADLTDVQFNFARLHPDFAELYYCWLRGSTATIRVFQYGSDALEHPCWINSLHSAFNGSD